MPHAPIIAIADDLTGAAEIAAAGFRHGLNSTVVLEGHTTASPAAELVVFDTDSRLATPRVAAEKLFELGQALARRPRAAIYKKIDSVLRGSVRTEIEVLAEALGLPRVLLLPANPALGRTIRGGRYAIDGVPLHLTAFAHDPHHPTTTDSVRTLLSDSGSPVLALREAGDSLPGTGIVVCNAASSADVQAWAGRVAPDDLPAGGAEFFSALLGQRGLKLLARPTEFVPGSPVLIVSGTTSPEGVNLRENALRDGIAIVPLPAAIANDGVAASAAIGEWIGSVQSNLARSGSALAVFNGPILSDAQIATAIRHAFAQCVHELVKRGAVRHLIVEGGATAAAIARELGWPELYVAHEWAHGVVSLRPAEEASVILTMKPGSYAWPDSLWQHILHTRPSVVPRSNEKKLP